MNSNGEEITLDEAAKRLEEVIRKPKPCEHCGKPTGYRVRARVRADNLKQRIIIGVSLSDIIGKLENIKHQVELVEGGKVLKITMEKPEGF